MNVKQIENPKNGHTLSESSVSGTPNIASTANSTPQQTEGKAFEDANPQTEQLSSSQSNAGDNSDTQLQKVVESPKDHAPLDQIHEELCALRLEFTGKLKYDTHKNEIIDKLHGELQEYRNDLLGKLMRPMITDAILLADDVRKIQNAYSSKDPEQLDPVKLLNLFASFSDDLENLLYRQGLNIFASVLEDGPQRFDPERQTVTQKVATSEAQLDRTIYESLGKGYEWQGTVLRPEKVAVYVYHAPAEKKI